MPNRIASFAVLAALSSIACATTTFTSTWKAPDAQPFRPAGSKVAAVVMTKDEAGRRAGEDALARELTKRGAQGIPMYTLGAEGDPTKEADTKAALERAGVVGVVTMRPVGKDKELVASSTMYAGPYYGGYWGGYYGYGWGAPWGGVTVSTNTIVAIETLVYSLKQNKIVWAGQSKTTNPSNVDSFIKEIVDAAAKEMKKQGLL